MNDFCTDGRVCKGNAYKNLDKNGVCPACAAAIRAEIQVAWEEKEEREKEDEK